MANKSSKKPRQSTEGKTVAEMLAVNLYIFSERLKAAASWREDSDYVITLLLKSPN